MSFETYSTVAYEVIEIDEVNRKFQIPAFAKLDGGEVGTSMIDKVENKIKTVIYTDGKVSKIEESEPQEISEYYFGKKPYEYDVNELIKKRLYIEGASFIVKVTVADEIMDYESKGSVGRGHFYVMKSSEILVKDRKDKEAIKKAKETVKMVCKDTGTYSSIWDAFLKRKVEVKTSLEYETSQKDIYQLKTRSR